MTQKTLVLRVAPGEQAALEERLPSLLAEFKRDMLALGFTYPEVSK